MNERSVERSGRSLRNRQNRNRRNNLRPEPTFRGLGVRGMSAKKHRRYANGRHPFNGLPFLLSFHSYEYRFENYLNCINYYYN